MIEFKKNIEDRKGLVQKLEDLTGSRSVYTRAPEYAYLVGDYKVDRNGNLIVDENVVDQSILVALLTEGIITMPDEMNGADESAEEDEADGAENTEETIMEEPVDEEPTAEAEEQEPTEQETVGEPAEEEPAEETTEEPEPAEEQDEEQADDEAEPIAEPEAEATTEDEDVETEDNEIEEPLALHVSFPAEKHTGVSLRNLFYLIYSRAELINKATGSHFWIDENLIEALKDDTCTYSTQNFRKAIGKYEDAHGLSMEGLILTPETVTFTGFATGMDADHCKACTDLAAAMNQMAIKQNRIQAKAKHADNEKYAFRIWLVRMGMDGDDYKRTRKILMEKLSGHTAFRTQEDAERAKEKAQKKRDELRAEFAAAVSEATVTEVSGDE